MPIFKEPIKAKCFFCKKFLFIKFVPPLKRYSRKNDWDYWTEREENKGKKACDECLRCLYKNFKKDFRNYITSLKLRNLLGSYLNDERYSKKIKNPFKIVKKQEKK